MSDNSSISGWNFVLAAALKRVNNKIEVLCSMIAVPYHTVMGWQRRQALPTARAVRALRKMVADHDAPKVTSPASVSRPRGSRGGHVGHAYCRRDRATVDLRSGDRRRYGRPKRLGSLSVKEIAKGRRGKGRYS